MQAHIGWNQCTNACIVYKLFAFLHYSIIHFDWFFFCSFFLAVSSSFLLVIITSFVIHTRSPHISHFLICIPHICTWLSIGCRTTKWYTALWNWWSCMWNWFFHNCCAASVNFVKLPSNHVCASCMCVCVRQTHSMRFSYAYIQFTNCTNDRKFAIFFNFVPKFVFLLLLLLLLLLLQLSVCVCYIQLLTSVFTVCS